MVKTPDPALTLSNPPITDLPPPAVLDAFLPTTAAIHPNNPATSFLSLRWKVERRSATNWRSATRQHARYLNHSTETFMSRPLEPQNTSRSSTSRESSTAQEHFATRWPYAQIPTNLVTYRLCQAPIYPLTLPTRALYRPSIWITSQPRKSVTYITHLQSPIKSGTQSWITSLFTTSLYVCFCT